MAASQTTAETGSSNWWLSLIPALPALCAVFVVMVFGTDALIQWSIESGQRAPVAAADYAKALGLDVSQPIPVRVGDNFASMSGRASAGASVSILGVDTRTEIEMQPGSIVRLGVNLEDGSNIILEVPYGKLLRLPLENDEQSVRFVLDDTMMDERQIRFSWECRSLTSWYCHEPLSDEQGQSTARDTGWWPEIERQGLQSLLLDPTRLRQVELRVTDSVYERLLRA